MSVTMLLTGPLGTTLGWSLVHLLWQATAVALILAAIRSLWIGASSNARYITALVALVAVLILPALTFVHLWDEATEGTSLSAAVAGTPVSDARMGVAYSPSSERGPASGLESWISSRLPWLVGIWMAGVMLLGLRLCVRTVWTTRLTRDRVIEVEGSWHRVLARLCRKIELGRAIAMYESALVEVPTVVGWLKPVILVPTSVFTGLTYRQIETILAHELAHVQRHDALVNFLQSMVETLFFFHPAVWWISGRIRIEREHCCDEVAVRVCGDRVAYVKALTFLEEMRATAPASALAATGGSLLERIRRIAGADEPDRKAASIAALVLLLTLGGATAWAVSSPQPEPGADLRVDVSGPGWWTVTPPTPPSPPTPPAPPSVRSFSVDVPDVPLPPSAPSAPAPPAPPEAPSVSFEEIWIVEAAEHLASFDCDFEGMPRPEVPAAPQAPLPPRAISGVRAVSPAPAPPDPPAPIRVARLAPRAESSWVVRGERIKADDRKISEELTVEDLVRLRAVGVSAEYLRALRSHGYTDVTIGQAIAMGSVGVSAEYIDRMRQSGHSNLSVDDLVRLRGVGVTPEYVQGMRDAGFGAASIEELVHLRGAGVTPAYVKSIRDAGLGNLTVENLIRLRAAGVDADFIRDLKQQ